MINKSALSKATSKLKTNLDLLDEHGATVDHFFAKTEPIRIRGYLTVGELRTLAEWKSTRRAALTISNSAYFVRKQTERAFQANSEEARINALTKLHGIGVPTASAILAWIWPDRWAVIDVRAWKTLVHFDVVASRPKGTGLGPRQWVEYCQVIEHLSRELGLTPQRVDRLLYAYDKYVLSPPPPGKKWRPTKTCGKCCN